jgi:hypothetical protein
MTKEFRISIVTISILSGALNLFFVGFGLGLSGGGPELTSGEVIGNISFWSSLVHVVISSWLFISYNITGRTISILTSLTSSLAPILIISQRFSTFWFLIILCFTLTALVHAIVLTKTYRIKKIQADT